MTKPILMVGFNYGKRYESFLPIWAYSVFKSYPDYDVALFSSSSLSDNTRQMLDLVSNIAKGELIVREDYKFGYEGKIDDLTSPHALMSLRWLFYSSLFDNYDTLYIGDIDIFICPEDGGLLEQHLNHAQNLGLPYSNMRRECVEVKLKPERLRDAPLPSSESRGLLGNLLKRSNPQSVHPVPLVHEKTYLKLPRLSGLHFLKTKEWYSAVAPLFDGWHKTILEDENLIRNNEHVLFELARESGLGVPPIDPSQDNYQSVNSHLINWRPLHGIHLGTFRKCRTLSNHDWQMLQSELFREYFKHYLRLKRGDSVLESLLDLADPLVAEVFERCERYYGQIDEDEIIL